jgi:stalled ribosome rescue protein Dom34
MSYIVLWIDHDHAKIFNFKNETPETSHLKNHHHLNHHNTRHQENEKHEEQKKFYHEVHDKITGAKGLLLVGPG